MLRSEDGQNDGNIGKSVTIPATTNGVINALMILRASGDDTEPEVYTVSLRAYNRNKRTGQDQFASVQPRVDVCLKFGAGGVQQEAFITVGRGCQVTVPGTYCEVSVVRAILGPDPGEVIVSAHASYGPRPGLNLGQAPVFEVDAIAPAGGDVAVNLPPFCWAVSVLAADSTFYGAAGAGAAALDQYGTIVASYPRQQFSNLQLPAAATRLVITNALGAPVPVTAIFALAL